LPTEGDMTATHAAPSRVSAPPAEPRTIPPRPRPSAARRKWRPIPPFAAPALIAVGRCVIVPVALAAVYSLYNWNGLGPLERFIGLDNYVRAFSDPLFIKAIGNNATIVIASILIQGPLAIAVALLLNRRMRGRSLIRALIFVPYVLAEVVAGLSWKLLLSPRGGINAMLEG